MLTGQRPEPPPKKDPSVRLMTITVAVLSVFCLVLWGLALYRANYFHGLFGTDQATATLPAAPSLSCQDLIKQALHYSGNYCDHIGPNKVCYGNITIQADLLPQAGAKFSKTGDVVDIQILQQLFTAPLDLKKKEWGIAIFNIIANLPRSLPGESVKMVVFGNTTLGNNPSQKIQSFYFFSELGQISCEQAPMDGIMISMPNGTGVELKINGSDLQLMGNASLTAVKNGNMIVNLFSGTASLSADGQTIYFGAGQKAQVPLGGASGTDPAGPPSLTSPVSAADLQTACALSGIGCSVKAIPTTDALALRATIQSNLATSTSVPTPSLVPATPVYVAPVVKPTKRTSKPADNATQPAPTAEINNNPPPGDQTSPTQSHPTQSHQTKTPDQKNQH